MLPGEARVGAVLVGGRRADRERGGQLATRTIATFDRVAPHRWRPRRRSHRTARPRGGTGRPSRSRLAQPDRLRAEDRRRRAPRRAGRPCSPEHRHLAGSRRRRARAHRRRCAAVASRVPTTPGIPYSRATIAECESRPPLSVTIAPSSGSRMLNASVVDSVTRTSPCWIRSNSAGPVTRRAGPSKTPAARGEAAQQVLLVLGLGAAEQHAERDAGRGHEAARRRAGGPTGRAGEGRVAEEPRRLPSPRARLRDAPPSASSSADGPRRPDQRRHLLTPASTMWRRRGSEPRAASRRPAAIAARRMSPEAQMSLKTPRSSRRRYMRRASPSSSSNSSRCSSGTLLADARDRVLESSPRSSPDGGADRPQQHVGHLERVPARDVEAVEQPVADQVEVAVDACRPSSSRARSSVEDRGRVAVGLDQLRASGSDANAATSACELVGRARRHRRRAAHQPEQVGRRQAGPVLTWAMKSPVGMTAAAV